MESQDAMHITDAAQRMPVSIIIADARLKDTPITFVNDAFQQLTLYSREYALGRNCRFLQGEETDPADIATIRHGLQSGSDFQVTITNHRADGTPFRNQLLIAPVFGDDGSTDAYFCVQREVADDTGDHAQPGLDLLRELQHRVKNHLSMVVSMIRSQARRPVTPDSLRAVGRRVEALALLYEELFNTSLATGAREAVHTGAYLSRIASVIAGIGSRTSVRVNVSCEEIDLPVDQAAWLGLMLSELLTNSLEHAFIGRDGGFVTVTFKRISGGGVRLTVEDDGIGLPRDSNWPYGSPSVEEQRERARREDGELDTTGHHGKSGVGGSIILALSQTLGATLDVNRALRGTIVTVDFEPQH